jgi:23S rRNA (cytidine1920-2'-O)/16S rRNA (cytidine1409-2'-O)-methyltransferase
VERGLAESRHQAQALILSGRIRVPGVATAKPGLLIPPDQPLELLQPALYVSRGGEKLEGALKHFQVRVQDRFCWDVGASTGGFTDCLLQNGARQVAAIDVGRGQLHWKLRQDPRVINLEKTHILHASAADLSPGPPSLVTVDVSFISLEKVLPHLARLVPPGTEFLALLKPQFEAGPKLAPKGVVRHPKIREEILQRIQQALPAWGFRGLGSVPSALKGPKGNQETFLHFVRA